MSRYDSELRRRIQKATKEAREQLTDEQVFSCSTLTTHLERLASAIVTKKTPSIRLVNLGRDATVAATDTTSVMLNWGSELVQSFPNLEQRLMAVLGLFFHELAHCRYWDFDEEKRAREYIEKGIPYGAPDVTQWTGAEQAAWDEIEAALPDPMYARIISEVFHVIGNHANDVHDENAIISRYGQYAGEGIHLCRSSLQARCPSYEEMLEHEAKPLELAYSVELQALRFGTIVTEDRNRFQCGPYGNVLATALACKRDACEHDDLQIRYGAYWRMLVALWPYIKEQAQGGSNEGCGEGSSGSGGDSNGGDGSSSPGAEPQGTQDNAGGQLPNSGSSGLDSGSGAPALTEAQAQSIIDALKNAAKSAGQTQAPSESRQSTMESVRRRADARAGRTTQELPASVSESAGQLISKIVQAATELALADLQDELNETESADMIAAANAWSTHKGVPLNIERASKVSEADIALYHKEMDDLQSSSKRLQKEILNALRDMKDGYINYHRIQGKMFCAEDSYRPDGRCFANKKLPEDLPDMAIAILVDGSGSMRSGCRLPATRRAAMFLHDFARGLEIPVHVAGHRTIDQAVEYTVYADFQDKSGKDKYRLSQMNARGCNRDGMAIAIAIDRLAQRPEQLKLLVIVSDGQPNHTDYGGELAERDIQEIVRRGKRRGVETIAAAIGDDRTQIRRIYGESFLDVSDLQKLPKTFVNIVKKRLLAAVM